MTGHTIPPGAWEAIVAAGDQTVPQFVPDKRECVYAFTDPVTPQRGYVGFVNVTHDPKDGAIFYVRSAGEKPSEASHTIPREKLVELARAILAYYGLR